MEIWFLLIFAGLIAGLLAGLLGIGGGFVMVPVLMWVLPSASIPDAHLAHFAIATSLLCICVTSVFSTLAHQKRKAVSWDLLVHLAPGLIIGALAGASVAVVLSSKILIVIFITGAVLTALYLLSGYQPKPRQSTVKWPFFAYGIFSGIISALIGIGGGSLIVPFLIYQGKATAKAVATAAACGFPIAVCATVGYALLGMRQQINVDYAVGYLYLPAFFCLAVFSSLTAPLGAKLAHFLPEKKLRQIFALFLFFTGAQIIYSHWF